MSVPGTFTEKEIAKGHAFLVSNLGTCRIVKGKTHGQPLVTYGDLADHMGWTIEDQFDGDRMGNFSGAISHMEMDLGGPMLSACVVRKESNGYPGNPGKGFYEFGMIVGKLASRENVNPDGSREMAFWTSEVEACVAKYGS